MDTNDSDSNGPASMLTALPAPPRMPTFIPASVIVTAHASESRPGLVLVASNPHPNPMQTRATVPVLRRVRELGLGHPSAPPPWIPPTGSTPIRRAA